MSSISEKCIEAYSRAKNLKIAANEVGIPWQTVYVHLKKAGVSVCGDKARYGSASDRFAAKSEARFRDLVPFAVDNNQTEFQSTIDFTVGDFSVDVKAARLKPAGSINRWSYCVNKQRDIADFFVLYAYNKDGDDVDHVFLIPGEIARTKTTISITESLKSKWADYEVSEPELIKFFVAITE